MSVLLIALVMTGAALLVAEAHVASYGVLGVLGIAALVGAFVLGADAAGVGLALTLVVAGVVALALGACVLAAALRVRAVHRRRALGGADGLVGQLGVVRSDVAPVGHVSVRGELWRACCSPLEDEDRPPTVGDPVVVERVDGLTVSVRRAEEWEVLP
jgi:membrane-bound serine protease (ClpP class)